jgi:hypothetical protein
VTFFRIKKETTERANFFLQKKVKNTWQKKNSAFGQSVFQALFIVGFGRVESEQDFFAHIFHQTSSPEHFIFNT